MDWDLIKHFFIALLAIVNPLGKIPLWLKASAGQPAAARTWLSILVMVAAGLILLAALWVGQPFLELFGIDLAAFRVGGGVIIMLVAVQMLNGVPVRIAAEERTRDDVSPRRLAQRRFQRVVVPLAMPFIAGPGTISTVLVYSSKAADGWDYAGMSGALLLVLALIWLTLAASRPIERVLGDTVLEVQTRLFGLILAAVAAQLIIEGLGEAYPTWLQHSSPISDDVTASGQAQSSTRD